MTPEGLIIESLFRIANKEGQDVDFILNSVQKELDSNLTGRDLIPKLRQPGISSYFLARYTAACLRKRNVKAVIISHEGESTQRLLSRCQYFLNNIRGPAPVIGRSGMNIITFPKMDSMIYIGTAGSKKFGRGDTVTHCHCSEYAYWPNPKDILAGLLQAVPMSGEVAIESTGNGVGNDYHRRVMRAYEGVSEWKCHFFGLQTYMEYAVELTDDEQDHVLRTLNDEWEEPQLVAGGLSAGQIIWRRIKLEELDYDLKLFKQEYPITLDECFQASGDSIFHRVRYEPTNLWKYQGNHLHILDGHPVRAHKYVVGVDPSGGTGRDNAAAEIFDITSGEQVGEYAHNRVEPDILGGKVVDLAEHFNNAYIVVESNNHGPMTLDRIRERDYPSMLIYSMEQAGASYEDKSLMQMGFRTSMRTKPIMVGKLRSLLAKQWVIHSPALNGELSTFIEHEDGKLAAQSGCKDDRVMAGACAAIGLEHADLYAGDGESLLDMSSPDPAREPFTLDGIIKECSTRNTKYPISPQHHTQNEVKI